MPELTWGILLAAYLFLGGMAGGAYTISALVDLFKKGRYKVLSKSGAYISLVSIIVGLVLLILDLKRLEVAPLSPLNAYIRFPDSIMTVGTWIITGLTLVSLMTTLLWFFKGNTLVRKLLEIVGIVLGVSTAAYTGILLSFARGRLFWASPFLPWTFVISGTLTGLVMALLLIPIIAVLIPRFSDEFKDLVDNREDFTQILLRSQRYIVILIGIEFVLLVLELGTGHGAVSLFTIGSLLSPFISYIIIGLIAPLGIAYYTETVKFSRSNLIIPASLTSYVLISIGGFLLRYVVLTAGQII